MYYVAKIIQAAGLGIILLGFIQQFPRLMNPRLLTAGILIFAVGYIIQQFLLRR